MKEKATKPWRRIIGVLLCAAMLSTCIPTIAFAEEITDKEEVTEEILGGGYESSTEKETEITGNVSEEDEDKIDNSDDTVGETAIAVEESKTEETDSAEIVKILEVDSEIEDDTENAATASEIEDDIESTATISEIEDATISEIISSPFYQEKEIDGIIVSVAADENVFPDTAELVVNKVSVEDELGVINYTYDIKVIDADGTELQPQNDEIITVSFKLKEKLDDDATAVVYHEHETEDGNSTTEILETVVEENTVSVESTGFSLYTLSITPSSHMVSTYDMFKNALKYAVGTSDNPATIHITGSFEITDAITLENIALIIDDGCELTVSKEIKLVGTSSITGGTLKRGSDYHEMLLNIASNATISLVNLTVDGGAIWNTTTYDAYYDIDENAVQALGYSLKNDGNKHNGRMVYIGSGTIATIDSCTFKNNDAQSRYRQEGGSSDFPSNPNAGAILNGGNLTMTNTTIQYCVSGAGVLFNSGILVCNNCIIEHNAGVRDKKNLYTGGGVRNEGSSFVCNNTVFRNNISETGAGILSFKPISLYGCHVYNNYSWGAGAGVYTQEYEWSYEKTVILQNTVIENNISGRKYDSPVYGGNNYAAGYHGFYYNTNIIDSIIKNNTYADGTGADAYEIGKVAFKISGNSVIGNNGVGGIKSNWDDGVIVTDALGADAYILCDSSTTNLAIASGENYALTENDLSKFALLTTTAETKDLYLDSASNQIKICEKSTPPTPTGEVEISKANYTGTYDGNSHTFILNAEDGAAVTYYEDSARTIPYAEKPSFTDAGNNTVYYTATKSGKTDTNGSVTVTISKAKVTIPTNNKSYDFTGTEIVGVAETNDYSVSNGSATAVGDYSATVSLKDSTNHMWSDSTTEAKTINWSIKEVKTTITLTFAESEHTQKYEESSTYKNVLTSSPDDITSSVTYTSSKPAIATVDTDGTVHILDNGYTMITANYAGDATHSAASAYYWLYIPNKDTDGHVYTYIKTTIKEPTYTETGRVKIEEVCTICGYILSTSYEDIPVLVSDSKSSGSSSATWTSVPTSYGSSTAPINNGTWGSGTSGIWQYKVNGETLKNATAWISYTGADGKPYTGCFYFDKSGNMQTGWQKIDTTWYFFDTTPGSTLGMMKTSGWITTDGKQYYVGSDGKMLANTTTPDGHKVDATGARID